MDGIYFVRFRHGSSRIRCIAVQAESEDAACRKVSEQVNGEYENTLFANIGIVEVKRK